MNGEKQAQRLAETIMNQHLKMQKLDTVQVLKVLLLVASGALVGMWLVAALWEAAKWMVQHWVITLIGGAAGAATAGVVVYRELPKQVKDASQAE